VLVDGRRLAPQSVAGGLHRFVLPGDAEAVVIASRAAVPAEIHDLHPDGRRLGVMLAHISFRQDGRTHRIGLDSLPDDAGFHAFEQADGQGWRWTDGYARVQVPAGFVPDRELVLDLLVTASLPAWTAPGRQSSEATGRSAAA